MTSSAEAERSEDGIPGVWHEELQRDEEGAPVLQGAPHQGALRGSEGAGGLAGGAEALRTEVRVGGAAGPRGEALPRARAARGARTREPHPHAAGRRPDAAG